jgi:hypothetical protein
MSKRQQKPDSHLAAVFAAKRVVSEDAAATLLGISPDTLRRTAQRDGKPERLRLSPRRVGYRLSDILAKAAAT